MGMAGGGALALVGAAELRESVSVDELALVATACGSALPQARRRESGAAAQGEVPGTRGFYGFRTA